jgi:hypothetical protein
MPGAARWEPVNDPPPARPWTAEKIAGGYVVRDANGQALAYVYSRATESDECVKIDSRRASRNRFGTFSPPCVLR